MFYGDITVMEPICLVGGVLGYCGEGLFASYRSPTGADVFDVLNPASGVYWTAPPGSAVTNSSGRTSTSTGSLGFSDQVWTWANNPTDFPAINQLIQSGRPWTDVRWDAAIQQLSDIISGDYAYLFNSSAASGSPNWVPFGPVPVNFGPPPPPIAVQGGTVIIDPSPQPPIIVPQWAPLPGFGGP
jgi:hypothetical protein